jgi:hypothetical protein
MKFLIELKRNNYSFVDLIYFSYNETKFKSVSCSIIYLLNQDITYFWKYDEYFIAVKLDHLELEGYILDRKI